MLTACGGCNDDAEHTYCMQVMLDKVPKKVNGFVKYVSLKRMLKVRNLINLKL
jgi:hypothetical protein